MLIDSFRLSKELTSRIEDVKRDLENYRKTPTEITQETLSGTLFVLASGIFLQHAWKEFVGWAGDKKLKTFHETRSHLMKICMAGLLKSEHLDALQRRLVRREKADKNLFTKNDKIGEQFGKNLPHLLGHETILLRSYFKKSFKRIVAAYHFATAIDLAIGDRNASALNLKKLSERVQLAALQFSFHTAKIPLQRQTPPLHLCYLDYIWSNEPTYYRGDGGATIRLYLAHLSKLGYSFIDDTKKVAAGIVSFDQFSLLIQKLCGNPAIQSALKTGSFKTFPIVQNAYQYHPVESWDALKTFSFKGKSPPQFPLLDVTKALMGLNVHQVNQRIGECQDYLKRVPFLALPGTLIVGAFQTKPGVGVYFILKNDQNIDPLLDVFSNLQSATGAYPELNDLRRALIETGYSLIDAIELYPFRDEMPEEELLDRNFYMPAPQLVTQDLLQTCCQRAGSLLNHLQPTPDTCPLTVLYVPIVKNFIDFASRALPRLSAHGLMAQHYEGPALNCLSAIHKRLLNIIALEGMKPSSQRFREIFQEFSLIAEEMILLYAILNPEPLQHLEQTLDHYPFVPKDHSRSGIEKATFIFNSGMACYNAFVASYPVDPNGSKPTLQFMRGCYFELTLEKGFKDYIHQSFHISICKTEEEIAPCDIFCLDLYPNCATDLEVKANDIKALILKVMANRQSPAPLTIILDTSTTIAWNPAVDEIIGDFQDSIRAGRLNFVIINSLAKFALCGLDKFPGGLTQTYCHIVQKPEGALSRSLQETAVKLSFRLSPEARRFFSFFLIDNKKQIEAYIDKTLENTNAIYDKLIDVLGKENSCLRLGKRDARIPMMGLHVGHFHDKLKKFSPIPAGQEEETLANLNYLIYYFLYAQANKRGLTLMIRPSFGFPHTALIECWSAIRLTIGVEDREILNAYISFFKEMNQELENFLSSGEAAVQLLKLVLNPPKASGKTDFEVPPTMRHFIEHHEFEVLKAFEQTSFLSCFKKLQSSLNVE